jgi:antitoxin component YwqK of YwqJK toxin-antitoxin module
MIWHRNGTRWLSDYWIDGVPQGKTLTWHRNGQPRTASAMQDGKIADGLHSAWHENGQKLWDQEFVNGHSEGQLVRWFDNGVLEETGHYKAGQRVGVWKFWSRSGELLKTQDLGERCLRMIGRPSAECADPRAVR